MPQIRVNGGSAWPTERWMPITDWLRTFPPHWNSGRRLARFFARIPVLVTLRRPIGSPSGQHTIWFANVDLIATDAPREFSSDPLTAHGAFLLQQQMHELAAGLSFQSSWNPATNVPELPATPTQSGQYWVASEAGERFGLNFAPGDWLVSTAALTWNSVPITAALRTEIEDVRSVGTSNTSRIGGLENHMEDVSETVANLLNTHLRTVNATVNTAQNTITAILGSSNLPEGFIFSFRPNAGISLANTMLVTDGVSRPIGYMLDDGGGHLVFARNHGRVIGMGMPYMVQLRLGAWAIIGQSPITSEIGDGQNIPLTSHAGFLLQQQLAALPLPSNPNILHNGDFRNPVNQRGQTSYPIAANAYNLDCWFTPFTRTGSTINIMGGYINVNVVTPTSSASTLLSQRFEFPEFLRGRTVTASIKVRRSTMNSVYLWVGGAGISGFSNIGEFDDGESRIISHTWTLSADQIPTMFSLVGGPNVSGEIDFEAVKLELGTVSTLANDPPADFGRTLADCQRFQLGIDRPILIGIRGWRNNEIILFVPTPTTMRVNPSAHDMDEFDLHVGGQGYDDVIFTFLHSRNVAGGVQLVYSTNVPLSGGYSTPVSVNFTGLFLIDANL